MKRISKLQGIILVILLAALVFMGALIAYRTLAGSYEGPEPIGEETEAAPDFTVYNADGEEVRLSDFLGKPVVVNCWASWCGPCQAEMPHFQTAWEVYGEDAEFLMLNMNGYGNDTRAAAAEFVEAGGYTFPVYYDDEGMMALTYGINQMPISLFFDEAGQLAAAKLGAMDYETLEAYLAVILE